jgi:hypothetical protein
MSGAIQPPSVIAWMQGIEARVSLLERAPTGRASIGLLYLRPGIKTSTPSDGDYMASALPPIGSIVTDTVGSKLWVRTAVATWKGVVIA